VKRNRQEAKRNEKKMRRRRLDEQVPDGSGMFDNLQLEPMAEAKVGEKGLVQCGASRAEVFGRGHLISPVYWTKKQ